MALIDHPPALTPDEWAVLGFVESPAGSGAHIVAATGHLEVRGSGVFRRWLGRYRLAALALYGTPGGFTHDDLEFLEWVYDKCLHSDESLAKMDRIAKKVRALLPPSPDA